MRTMVQRQNLISIATTTALCLVLGGAAVFAIKSNTSSQPPKQAQILTNPKSQVLPLVPLSATERALQLNAIANLPPSVERDRARYLLASDLIAQNSRDKALPLLENLEQSYSVLAAPIALKRAQAVNTQAQWQELLTRHADSPLAAEALFALG